MSNRSSQEELSTRSITNTQTFFETCVLDADHKALEEHLRTHPVEQSDLDICLLRGLQIVERKIRRHRYISSVNHQETITSCWI